MPTVRGWTPCWPVRAARPCWAAIEQAELPGVMQVREKPIRNRVTAVTGSDYPIIQAPMGWIARAQLASAVSNAGGLGIIKTSPGEVIGDLATQYMQ